jgi:hypothetical protein
MTPSHSGVELKFLEILVFDVTTSMIRIELFLSIDDKGKRYNSRGCTSEKVSISAILMSTIPKK